MSVIDYKCPKCGGTDLRIRCTFEADMVQEDGYDVGAENPDTDPWEVEDGDIVICKNHKCREEGPLVSFRKRSLA